MSSVGGDHDREQMRTFPDDVGEDDVENAGGDHGEYDDDDDVSHCSQQPTRPAALNNLRSTSFAQ